MDCCGKVRKRKRKCCSKKRSSKKASVKYSNSCNKSKYKVDPGLRCPGRNPFLLFLTHFRKQQKAGSCNLSAFQSAAIAGKVWIQMKPVQKAPFIKAASTFNYTFKSRNKQVNWTLEQLRLAVGGEQISPQCLWALVREMKRWKKCVLNELLNLEDEDDSDTDAEEPLPECNPSSKTEPECKPKPNCKAEPKCQSK